MVAIGGFSTSAGAQSPRLRALVGLATGLVLAQAAVVSAASGAATRTSAPVRAKHVLLLESFGYMDKRIGPRLRQLEELGPV